MIGLPDEHERKTKKIGVAIVASIFLLTVFFSTNLFSWFRIAVAPSPSDVCPIVKVHRPKLFYEDNSTVTNILFDKDYRKTSVHKLSKAIQIDTQIYDNPPPVDEDPEYWAKFEKFHKYLEQTFPTVYDNLEVAKVNTYGLVFYWKGSNPDLKPLMLTAHQDVVPIQNDTIGDWTYPPLSGHYDGEKVYGRGVADCKNVLVSIMETLELLIEKKFQPERGIIAAFGMDEEVSGWHGALKIADYIQEKFGRDSIYAIIDEGMGLTRDPITNKVIALPGTGEKGYVDIEVVLTTPGGHSSVPPDHTSIGIMSELAYFIEKDPYSPILTEENPTLHQIQCIAAHDNEHKMPRMTRKLILRAGFDKVANEVVKKALYDNIITRYLILTSQALDIVKGGEKNNALPESVKLLVNHRIAIESNVEEVKERFILRVLEVAKRHELGVVGFGDELEKLSGKGYFDVHISGKDTQTAPVTPTGDKLWHYLGGVTRHIYEDFVFPDIKYPVLVSPSIMTGNTDTRHYWNLTDHIYRYCPIFVADMMKDTHVHSVDEQLEFDNHLRLTAFFYEFIQLVQE